MLPIIVTQAMADRAFLGRVIRHLAGHEGLGQFLDIGTGLPTAENTHEVAQRVARRRGSCTWTTTRWCWCTPGRCSPAIRRAPAKAEGDRRDPEQILATAAATLDVGKPVALLLFGVLPHIPYTGEAYRIIRHPTRALAPGSFLAISHSTSAIAGEAMYEAVRHWNAVGTPSMTLRFPDQIIRFFDGLDLLAPGVVSCSRWRPDTGPAGEVGDPSTICDKAARLLVPRRAASR